MTLNVNPYETQTEEQESISTSDVPVYQMMDAFNTDSDFDNSDDSDPDNYELLSQDFNESN